MYQGIMKQPCHRCGTIVANDFCPNCGAPQLNFDAAEHAALSEGADAALGRSGKVQWPVVLIGCAKVAVPAGILCALPVLSLFSLLWVVGAASAVIFLYRRKRPLALLSTRNGLRIGSLTGLIVAYASIAVSAVLRVMERFAMHNGASIDADYDQLIHQSMTMFQASSETQLQTLPYFRFMLTPDGRAAWSLMNMSTMTVLTVLLAAIGGAVGVRIFAGRRATQN